MCYPDYHAKNRIAKSIDGHVSIILEFGTE